MSKKTQENIRFSLIIKQSTYEKLRRIAFNERKKLAEVCRDMIEAAVAK